MGEIVDFRSREVLDALALAIRDSYLRHGAAMQSLESLTVPLEEWRKIARSVGRKLGRGVQTLVVGGDVHALLRDWPRDERERLLHDGAVRAIVAATKIEY